MINRWKPLVCPAATGGYETVVRLLLENGASINPKVTTSICIRLLDHCGHERVVRLLLQKGAEIDAKNFNGQTALYNHPGVNDAGDRTGDDADEVS